MSTVDPRTALNTRQTDEPLPDYRLNTTSRSAGEVAGTMLEDLDLNPPYQRGSVWTLDQRIALVKSWVMGVPIPAVTLNCRDNPEWARNEGSVASTGQPFWGVVDGKQRIETAVLWFTSRLAVPASWFPAERVASTTVSADGPYEGQLPSMRSEAELYLLVNGGGTAQTAEDMAHAAAVSASLAPKED